MTNSPKHVFLGVGKRHRGPSSFKGPNALLPIPILIIPTYKLQYVLSKRAQRVHNSSSSKVYSMLITACYLSLRFLFSALTHGALRQSFAILAVSRTFYTFFYIKLSQLVEKREPPTRCSVKLRRTHTKTQR